MLQSRLNTTPSRLMCLIAGVDPLSSGLLCIRECKTIQPSVRSALACYTFHKSHTLIFQILCRVN